eukprot:403355342
MIKRDLDEEQVTKNTIPLKKRGERSKLNSSQINMSNLTQNGVNSVKAKDGNSIVRQNIQHHLTTLTSNCDKYISTNPITINNSLTIQTQLKNNKTLYRNAQTTNATPEASKIRKGMFFSRHSRNNSQNYQPIVINSQFQRNLIQRQIQILSNTTQFHKPNFQSLQSININKHTSLISKIIMQEIKLKCMKSQLPNINEQMNFLTQDIQNAKNISTILKDYHEGLKSHQKSKSISVNSQSTLFNKNSFQNNNTKVVLTKLIGNSDPESQIILQQESLSTGMEQTMSYNQANNTMDYKNKINKLYEEQNNQKIKSIKEILNRSMGHRVKMSNDSSIMGTSVLRQRYLRPKLPTILAKTMQFENNKKQRVVQNSQNTSQTIDKFDEISIKNLVEIRLKLKCL